MKFEEIFTNKTLKQKTKTELLGTLLLNKKIAIDELIAFAKKSTAIEKATCIEAIEYATRKEPTIANQNCWSYLSKTLTEEAPRVKWESARVIGNIAHLFPSKLSIAITNLLTNTENDGTVVRWATALALSEIVNLKSKHIKELLPALEALCNSEEDMGVKKKYVEAIKKSKTA